MITIVDERSQTEYGYTRGCTCCGTKELSNDIKEIRLTEGYISNAVTICKACRNELQQVLWDFDDKEESIIVAESVEAEVVETDMSVTENMEVNNIEPESVEEKPSIKELIDTLMPVLTNKNTNNSEEPSFIIGEVDESMEAKVALDSLMKDLIPVSEKSETKMEETKNTDTTMQQTEIVTVNGNKLCGVKLVSKTPLIHACENCEMEFDAEDIEYARNEGTCPYCGTDLTKEHDPDDMLVGKNSLNML